MPLQRLIAGDVHVVHLRGVGHRGEVGQAVNAAEELTRVDRLCEPGVLYVEPSARTAAAVLAAGGKTSRHGFPARAALAGSALVVGPVRFLVKPESTYGVVTCAKCSGGSKCCAGWTEFCCTLNNGVNACPPYSYIAGWWKCTSYKGSKLCAGEGVR